MLFSLGVARKVAGAAAGGAQGKMAAGHSQRVSYILCVPISYSAHVVPQSGRDSIEFQFLEPREAKLRVASDLESRLWSLWFSLE
jgi:hypothetical protein